MALPGIPADEATRLRWAELALSVRLHSWVVSTVSKPDAGTAFHAVDNSYPSEAISQWCREGIRSALDHLHAWADHVIPLTQYDGQVVRHGGFRWTFTLMRAGLEGAAQSLWLSSSKSHEEALARLVRMVRHDLGEQTLAFTAMGRDTSKIAARLAPHEVAAQALAAYGKPEPKLPGMVSMLELAADQAGRERGLIVGHWRACSAAAHGKQWAVDEFQTQVGDRTEWMPGQFHFSGYLDPARQVEILDDTLHMVSAAVVRYLQRSYSGDISALLRRASFEAAMITPQKDGGAHVEAVAREWGLLQQEPEVSEVEEVPDDSPASEG